MPDRLPEIKNHSTEPYFRLKIISETVLFGRSEYLLTCIVDIRVFGDNDWTYQFLDYQLLSPRNHKETWFGKVLKKHALTARFPLHDDDPVVRPLVKMIRATVTRKFVDELAEGIRQEENLEEENRQASVSGRFGDTTKTEADNQTNKKGENQ